VKIEDYFCVNEVNPHPALSLAKGEAKSARVHQQTLISILKSGVSG